MPNSAPGDVVGAKYRLISELGRGGMGTVWHARHMRLDCPIALKLIDPIIAKDPLALQRFLREARTAAALRGPHVVQILDYGVDGDTPYIAMELLDGESLAQQLARMGRLSAQETARVIRHVSRALGRAHDAGIVHRDLKPENLFVLKNGDETLIKVLDFGIAKAKPTILDRSANAMATHVGTLMGTPYFMSPEQAEGRPSVSFHSDIWALGVIAFECLLGVLPFKCDSIAHLILAICRDPIPVPSEIGPVPAGFDFWFARACARDPLDRFESAKQAADAFDTLDSSAVDGPPSRHSAEAAERHAIASEPFGVRVPRLAASEAPSAWLHHSVRLRLVVGMLGGALLLLVGVGLGRYWFQGAGAEVTSKPLRPLPAEGQRATAPTVPPGRLDASTADTPAPEVEGAQSPRSVANTDVSRPLEAAPAKSLSEPGANDSPGRDQTDVSPTSKQPEPETKTTKRPRKPPASKSSDFRSRQKAKPPVIDLGI
jgi:serine/threonine-protein kinase